jgi:undecaprenyl-diphosphatase
LSYLQALILGILQGLTEFLPVSSSGHLALAQQLVPGFGEDLFFDVLLHVATLLAVLVYFRRDLLVLVTGLLGVRRGDPGPSPFAGREWRTVALVILATVVTVAVGLPLKRIVVWAFSSTAAVGAGLLLTAALLFLSSRLRRVEEVDLSRFLWWQAMLVGFAQAAALMPGVSRSGATIAMALMLGLERDCAARFSFLIAIPAVAGAFLLEVVELVGGHEHATGAAGVEGVALGPYLVGSIAAAIVGFGAIHLLLRAVNRRWFHTFAYYCAPLGALALLWAWLS